MNAVYVLQHVHSSEEDTEDVKFIGVYSSRENAQRAIERLRRLPGFSKSQAGFCIDEYPVDQDQWAEGYVTVAT